MKRNIRGRIERLENKLGRPARLSEADRLFLAEHREMPGDSDPDAQRRWIDLVIALAGGTWADVVREGFVT